MQKLSSVFSYFWRRWLKSGLTQSHAREDDVVCFSHPSERASGGKGGWVLCSQTCPEVANFDLATSQESCSRIIGSWFKSIEMYFSCMWGGLLISSLGQSLKLFCDFGTEKRRNLLDGSCRISLSVCLTPSCELYFELWPLESHNVLYT